MISCRTDICMWKKPSFKKKVLRILHKWQLYVFMLPALLYTALFCYKPMYGILIAFKDFSVKKGIWGSDWVGFANFERLFSSYWFPIILKNTFVISGLSLLLGFPVPIILALILNEVKSRRFAIFFRIILPLSKPIIMVMILYYGITHWNSYFNAMIYLNDRDKYPLQLFLREILLQSKLTAEALNDSSITSEEAALLAEMAKSAELIKYCIIVVATLPMILIYPRLQKFFEKGVMIGSVKG